MNTTWTLLSFCVLAVLGMLHGAPASDSTDVVFNGTSLSGKTLFDMGTKFNKPLLRLIGKAMDNMNNSIAEHMKNDKQELFDELCLLNVCTEWSDWTECPAKTKGDFSMVTRTRTCGYDTSLCTSKSGSTTETQKMVCEGMCSKNYTLTQNGFCLKLVETKMDKNAAESTCQHDGGHVVNINSQTKSDDVHEILKKQNLNKETIWLNGKRADTSSPWQFTYETTLTSFANWKSTEPSNGNTELCKVEESSPRYWFDRECTDKYKFVCEFPV